MVDIEQIIPKQKSGYEQREYGDDDREANASRVVCGRFGCHQIAHLNDEK
ncbi:hypothetical protein GCM10023156_59310 [Novipirellula rosea]|uniref:Uncharacterized protein n=1 Tax=Novipirellula rosea TaxID=1031540 RepID=A0ABP8NNH6_9BACT